MKQNEINIKKHEDIMWLRSEGFTLHEIGQVKLPQLKGSDGKYHKKISRERVRQIINYCKNEQSKVVKLTKKKENNE